MADEVSAMSADEDQMFTEPNNGFKSILSRWHQRDHSNKDIVRLPGIKREDSKQSINRSRDNSELSKNHSTFISSRSKGSNTSLPVEVISRSRVSREISDMSDAPSKTSKRLSEMVQPRQNSRAELKEMFDASNPSYNTKRKVLRQPNNVYQASPEFTQDFKPPKFPKTDEEKDLIKKALKKNFVFANLTSKELKPLISAFEPCVFEVGETIIKQGDHGDYFYIVQKGRVVFQVDGIDVGKAGKGSSFGELALLYTCPRAATVVTAKKSKVFRVGQATFQFILQNQTAESAKEKVQLLKGVNFLKDLDPKHLKTLTNVMTPKIFQEGDLLVRKGDPGDAFYVIQEGEVLVKDISVGNTSYEDLVLGPGGHFGERALITSEPRAANIVGKTGGVAFSIDRNTFEKVLGGMESLVLRAGDARLLSGITLFRNAGFLNDIYIGLAELVTDSEYTKEQVIFKSGQKVAAALYIIRKGQVVISNREGMPEELLHTGEFFGQELILEGAKAGVPRIDAPYGATASTDCVLGVLTLADCRYIFDADLITGKKKVPSFALSKEDLMKELPWVPKAQIKLKDLEKRTILGTGSFGQVWLVQGTDEITGATNPYALKIQAKYGLYEEGQVSAVIREKQILSEMNHPFIVNLVATYQDPTFVYFLTEFVQGGELFSRIHKEEGSGMTEQEAKFYALGIADAIGYLHAQKVVYRDMKPENVLIGGEGFPKLVDFGFAKYCPDKTFTFCGTPGYVSPEIITKRGHDCSSDNWSLGILLYEMLSGENPFYFEGLNQIVLFRSIVEDDYQELTNVSKEAGDLVAGLLVKDPSLRLGSSKQQGYVIDHPWFTDLDLDAMRQFKTQPPWIPECANPYDAINFDDWSGVVDKSTETFLPLPPDVVKQFDEKF